MNQFCAYLSFVACFYSVTQPGLKSIGTSQTLESCSNIHDQGKINQGYNWLIDSSLTYLFYDWKRIIGRISPSPFSMQGCIILWVNFYKRHFLYLTYLQFWSVNWIMRQMLLQTKNKNTKNPGSENNEIRKCQEIKSIKRLSECYISHTKFTHPKQKRSSLSGWIRLDNT